MWASCYIGPRYNGTRLYMWYSLVTGELPSQRSSCRGPNASNPARGRTLPGQERPSNGRPDASQRRPGSMLCPVGLPGALSVDILALLLYWPTYAPITVRLTCTNHSAPYAPFWHILIFYFCYKKNTQIVILIEGAGVPILQSCKTPGT